MDLFAYMREKNLEKEGPLASRMRPRRLEEVVGQSHILAPGKLLYRAIKADKLGSILLYGPPGTGKTTLARVIAQTTKAHFCTLNATQAGKKDMEAVVEEAQQRMAAYGQKTILFVDEIHRFHKGQQDYLLPFVEDGTLVLIGATTENPYFSVNNALLSRSNLFQLHPLEETHIEELLRVAVSDPERGMGSLGGILEEEACRFLAASSAGDARRALNALELALLTTPKGEDGLQRITLEVAADCIQKKPLRYDKAGDGHYDTISAFIKSMRGSDPDAAIYYLAQMLEAGEEVAFVARRIIICAAEDVGNADPQALSLAVAAAQAVERLGMPEGRIPLAQAAAYVACAPKSNAAYLAIDEALARVRQQGFLEPPGHLRDAHYPGAAALGHGQGYLYAHDYPDHYVRQQYMPYELSGREFYRPDGQGYEKRIMEHMSRLRGRD